MEEPRYRTTIEPFTYLNGTPWHPGSEAKFKGWPKAELKLEAVNESARRIAHYYRKHAGNPHLPPSPWSEEHARFYLPGSLPSTHRDRLPPISEPMEGAPQYRTKFQAPFGNQLVPAGAVVTFLGSPRTCLEPANEPADRVVKYLERYTGRGDLPLAPWCDFERALFVPDIPERNTTGMRGPMSADIGMSSPNFAR